MFLPDDNQFFDTLRAERQAQYGVAIAYIKDRVGVGTEYVNEVARAVVSEAGGYYQLSEMPEEFGGVLGAGIAHRLVTQTEAQETMARLSCLGEAIQQGTPGLRALSFYALYAGGSLRTRHALFVLDYKQGAAPFRHGVLPPDVVPRFFKLRLEADPNTFSLPLGLTNGLQFFLAPAHTDSGHCLLATIARAPDMIDLSHQTSPAIMN